jgi:hypothetical protein
VLKRYEAALEHANGAPLSVAAREEFVDLFAGAYKGVFGVDWPERAAVDAAMRHSLRYPNAVTALIVGQCDRYSARARCNIRGLQGHPGHFACSCREVCEAVNGMLPQSQTSTAAAAAAPVQQQCSTPAVNYVGADVMQFCPEHIASALTPQQHAALRHIKAGNSLQAFRSAQWLRLHRACAQPLLLALHAATQRSTTAVLAAGSLAATVYASSGTLSGTRRSLVAAVGVPAALGRTTVHSIPHFAMWDYCMQRFISASELATAAAASRLPMLAYSRDQLTQRCAEQLAHSLRRALREVVAVPAATSTSSTATSSTQDTAARLTASASSSSSSSSSTAVRATGSSSSSSSSSVTDATASAVRATSSSSSTTKKFRCRVGALARRVSDEQYQSVSKEYTSKQLACAVASSNIVLEVTASAEALLRHSASKKEQVRDPRLAQKGRLYMVPAPLKRVEEACRYAADRATKMLHRTVLSVAAAAAAAEASLSGSSDSSSGSTAAAVTVAAGSSSSSSSVGATAMAVDDSSSGNTSSSSSSSRPVLWLPDSGLVLLSSQVAAAFGHLTQQQQQQQVVAALKTAAAAAETAGRAHEVAAADVAAARQEIAARARAGHGTAGWDSSGLTRRLDQALQQATSSERTVQQQCEAVHKMLLEAPDSWSPAASKRKLRSSHNSSMQRYTEVRCTVDTMTSQAAAAVRAVLVAASDAKLPADCVQPLLHQCSKRAVAAAPALCAVAAAHSAAVPAAVTVLAAISNGSQTKVSYNHYSAAVSLQAGTADGATVEQVFSFLHKAARKSKKSKQQQQHHKLVKRRTDTVVVSNYCVPEVEV